MILLNQLATIKGLCNRQTFSISKAQGQDIHLAFKNLYNQRKYHLGGGKEKKSYSSRRRDRDLPRNYNIHELEENREFRQSSYYADKYRPQKIQMKFLVIQH